MYLNRDELLDDKFLGYKKVQDEMNEKMEEATRRDYRVTYAT